MSQSAKIAFAKVVDEKLFSNNAFYMNAVDHSLFVDGEKVVIPVSGDAPGVVKNAKVFPLNVNGRLDSTSEYLLDEYATLPTRIGWDEKTILNYDKIASMTQQHQNVLNNEIAEGFLNLWLPTLPARILRTTGADGSANGPAGSTGSRKKTTASDLKRMRALFNKMNIPQEGRFALLDADMEAELTQDPEFVNYDKTGLANVMATGAVAQYASFQIYLRSKVGIYSSDTSTKRLYTDPVQSGDNLASLFWHKDYVTKAKGQVKALSTEDDPTYLGSIMNFVLRAGGRVRADQLGIAALVQG